MTKSDIELLEDLNVYNEWTVGGQYCYKYQIPGRALLIISHETKELAAEGMVKLLKKLGIIKVSKGGKNGKK